MRNIVPTAGILCLLFVLQAGIESDEGSAVPSQQILEAQLDSLKDARNLTAIRTKLDELLLYYPEHLDALSLRIYINSHYRENFQQVLTDLETSSGIRETPESWWTEIGYLYIDSGDPDHARQLADKGLELFPDNSELLVIRGEANGNLGDFGSAIDDYKKSLEIRPGYEYGMVNLAEAYFENGDTAEGLAMVDETLASHPTSHLVMHVRGNYFQSIDEFDKALLDLEQAAAWADPATQAYYFGVMSFVYQDMNDSDRACESAVKALKGGDSFAYSMIDGCNITLEEFSLSGGDRLIYRTTIPGADQLTVSLTNLTEEMVKFDWNLNSNEGTAGSVTVTEDAFHTSFALHNSFSDGSDLLLEDRTSIWLSHEAWRSLRPNNVFTMDTGSGEKTVMVTGEELFAFTLNGENAVVSAVVLESVSDETPEKFWILDEPYNTIILKMDSDWDMELLEAVTEE